MQKKIRKVAVLGSGVMGSSIAALMTNVGIETLLLDIVPKELDAQDLKKGLTLQSPAFRNKLAQTGLTALLRAKPAAFTVPENARLVTVGNFDDDLAHIADVDWIIEVVVERIDIKKTLLAKVETFRKPGTIVSTNTSGLPINKIAEGLSDECKQHFLGTHFFNPPRYMKLIELIPCNSTNKEVMAFMTDFCETKLGKGVVFAKDTPNFIANRLGIRNVIYTMKAMAEDGYTLDEVDALTGTALGRPNSATFRTLDMVGIDTVVHVARNVVDNVTGDAEKKAFTVPDFINKMLDKGLLGDKKEAGFYKRVKTADGSQKLSLNYSNLEYTPSAKAKFPIIDTIKTAGDAGKRIKALINSPDKAGQFAWKVTKDLLLYSAGKIPEITDDIINIDRAMKWGFNHELGPFETWDAIGLKESVARMEKEGDRVPEAITRMLQKGKDRFYLKKDGRTYYYDFSIDDYKELLTSPRIILLPELKERQNVVKSNAGASLVDMGNGVVCLEFHSPNNAVGADIVNMINFSIGEIENNFTGMVIGNHGTNFCVGANLMLILLESQNENWDVLEDMARQFQGAAMRIKFSEKPVVAAPFRMALGGGCEFCLASSRIRASSETYMGLVEVGVGVLPAGGGCKEMLLRNIENIPPLVPGLSPNGMQPDLVQFVTRAFEIIATAKVSTSAQEAQSIGYMRPQDKITVNQDFLLSDAKATVLALAAEGYAPPRRQDAIRVTGRTGMGLIDALLYNMKEGAFISEYDAHIARKVANVLTGGDVVRNTLVSEDYLLDLEREAFLSLCGEPKSQDRMRVMLADEPTAQELSWDGQEMKL